MIFRFNLLSHCCTIWLILLHQVISYKNRSAQSSSPLYCNIQKVKFEFTECDSFGGKWRVIVPDSLGQCVGQLSYTPTRVHSCFTSCEGGQFFNKDLLLCENCQPGHFSLSGGIVFDNFNDSLHQGLPDGFQVSTEQRRADFGQQCPVWFIDENSGNLVTKLEMKRDNSESGCVSIVTYTARIVKKGRLRFVYSYRTPSNMPLSLLFTFSYRFYDGFGVIEDDLNVNLKFPITTVERKFETIDVQLKSPGLYIFTWKSIVIKNFRNFYSFTDESIDRYGSNLFTFINPSNDFEGERNSGLFQNKLANYGVIRISKIIIEGLASASECTPCEPGTYAPEAGMKECLQCPKNTAFNESGAIQCKKCDPINQFAPAGSIRCLDRPVCGQNDYYVVPKEDCNPRTLKQEVEFKWIEPRICVDKEGIFKQQDRLINCTISNRTSECDLGMEIHRVSKQNLCRLCSNDYYRDEGMTKCLPCPPLTNPFNALWIRRWNQSLPGWSYPLPFKLAKIVQEDLFLDSPSYLNSYFSRQCFRFDDDDSDQHNRYRFNDDDNYDERSECQQEDTWIPFHNHIRTSPSAPLNSFLVLSLTVPLFRVKNGAEISFEFEFQCEIDDECYFLFVETRPDESDLIEQDPIEKDFQKIKRIPKNSKNGNNRKKYLSFSQQTINQIIKEWTKPLNEAGDDLRKPIHFRHRIERNVSLTFSWIFKRTKNYQSFARIDSLLLIGSQIPSAIRCQSCTMSNQSSSGCVFCPHNQYIEIIDTNPELNESSPNQTKLIKNFRCKTCPKNYYLNTTSNSVPLSLESCVRCGENMISDTEMNLCYSDCLVSFGNDRYDLRQIRQPIIYEGINLFTTGGTQYKNLYKISLCGHPKRNDLSTCLNNITVFADDSTGVRSFVCRSTIIQDSLRTFAAQSANLGDELIQISRSPTFENISVHRDFVESAEANKNDQDFHLFFKTKTPTSACKYGRRSTITIRCVPGLTNGGNTSHTVIKTPKSCPDGTCNGCDFHLLIETETAAACRLCVPYSNDYESVVGECIDGSQKVHYLNPKGCVEPSSFLNGSKSIKIIERSCTLLLPRQIQIGIILAIILGLSLLLLVFYFWNKNRSLEYKYIKLIENTCEGKNADDLTMDNCCVVEGDDEDDEDIDRLSFADKANNNIDHKEYPQDNLNHLYSTRKSNNRYDRRAEGKAIRTESQEMKQLYTDKKKDRSKPIDDEGYETVHLISANSNNNNNIGLSNPQHRSCLNPKI